MRKLQYLIGGICLLLALQLNAQSFEEGTHYTLIDGAMPTAAGAPVEIVEVFSYSCGHCYSFEPIIETYKKNLPDGVVFKQMHIKWDKVTENLSRAFYTSQALNNEAAHQNIFKAIHVDRKKVQFPEDFEGIFVAAGTDAETFNKTFNSFGVTSKVKRADKLIREYRVDSTPQLIVGGRYKIQAKSNISHQQMVEIADFLVAKIQAENS